MDEEETSGDLNRVSSVPGLELRARTPHHVSIQVSLTQRLKANGGPSLLTRLLLRTYWHSAQMSSTAVRQRWLAEKEGVKIGERVVGYAALECRRMMELYDADVSCASESQRRQGQRLMQLLTCDK